MITPPASQCRLANLTQSESLFKCNQYELEQSRRRTVRKVYVQ